MISIIQWGVNISVMATIAIMKPLIQLMVWAVTAIIGAIIQKGAQAARGESDSPTVELEQSIAQESELSRRMRAFDKD